nr:developmentally-regulated G-protein 3 [Ipomoea batatas]
MDGGAKRTKKRGGRNRPNMTESRISRVNQGISCNFVYMFSFFSCFDWQLLDLPGITEGAKDGKGRGRQLPPGVLVAGAALAAGLGWYIACIAAVGALPEIVGAAPPGTGGAEFGFGIPGCMGKGGAPGGCPGTGAIGGTE